MQLGEALKIVFNPWKWRSSEYVELYREYGDDGPYLTQEEYLRSQLRQNEWCEDLDLDDPRQLKKAKNIGRQKRTTRSSAATRPSTAGGIPRRRCATAVISGLAVPAGTRLAHGIGGQ